MKALFPAPPPGFLALDFFSAIEMLLHDLRVKIARLLAARR